MKEMLQNYLKKSDSFVGGTLTGFFCIFTIGIIPNFVENYNLMITLEVFVFSIWIGILFYRNQLLKNKWINAIKCLNDFQIYLNKMQKMENKSWGSLKVKKPATIILFWWSNILNGKRPAQRTKNSKYLLQWMFSSKL